MILLIFFGLQGLVWPFGPKCFGKLGDWTMIFLLTWKKLIYAGDSKAEDIELFVSPKVKFITLAEVL